MNTPIEIHRSSGQSPTVILSLVEAIQGPVVIREVVIARDLAERFDILLSGDLITRAFRLAALFEVRLGPDLGAQALRERWDADPAYFETLSPEILDELAFSPEIFQ